jgi:enoyl-CoA hydratase/carnithine racemase
MMQLDPTGVAIVTLNRPHVHNAINRAMQDRLLDVFLTLENEPSCGCIVLTGAGDRSFTAGFDIKEMSDLDQAGSEALSRMRDDWHSRILDLAVPVVSALNGWVLGAGVLLALASDIRVGCPETVIGFTAGAYGGVMYTAVLPLLVGRGKASEYLLMSDRVDAGEALASGLLNRVVPRGTLLAESHHIATRIAANPRESMRATKRLIRASEGLSLPARLTAEVREKHGLLDGAAPADVFSRFLKGGGNSTGRASDGSESH